MYPGFVCTCMEQVTLNLRCFFSVLAWSLFSCVKKFKTSWLCRVEIATPLRGSAGCGVRGVGCGGAGWEWEWGWGCGVGCGCGWMVGWGVVAGGGGGASGGGGGVGWGAGWGVGWVSIKKVSCQHQGALFKLLNCRYRSTQNRSSGGATLGIIYCDEKPSPGHLLFGTESRFYSCSYRDRPFHYEGGGGLEDFFFSRLFFFSWC